jgi:hypothetical protein
MAIADGLTLNNCTSWATICITPYSSSNTPTLDKLSGFPTHVIGDTTNYGVTWSDYVPCKPEGWHAGDFTVATADVVSQIFTGPLAAAGEVALPQTIGGTSVIPAAANGVAGTLVLYLARPIAAPRTRSLGSWAGVSGIPRYERLEGYYYKADDYALCYWYNGWPYARWVCPQAGYRALGFLAVAQESIDVTLGLTTQGVNGSTLIGESYPRNSTALARTVTTH